MKISLLLLAAGMGSRYGGLKQLDAMGPNGETLLDFSVCDAVRAGFDRVVFVIRRDFEEQFRREVGARFEKHVEVAYAFQDLAMLPAPFQTPEGREKPWGTGHAIWCAREEVNTPFAAINADDFYGREAYEIMAKFLRDTAQPAAEGTPAEFSMLGYELGRTLSEHGSVSRGVCEVDAGGFLTSIVEQTKIERSAEGGAQYVLEDGSHVQVSTSEPVSMNFWGFTPAVFPLLERGFASFLEHHRTEAKSEYYIPSAVAEMITAGAARVRVLPTASDWFGVTYREDRSQVTASLAGLSQSGVYPVPLWK